MRSLGREPDENKQPRRNRPAMWVRVVRSRAFRAARPPFARWLRSCPSWNFSGGTDDRGCSAGTARGNGRRPDEQPAVGDHVDRDARSRGTGRRG